MHLAGGAIWSAIAHEGATVQMMHGNGFGFNWKGLYVTSLMRAHDAWADSGRQSVGYAESHDHDGPVYAGEASWQLLRQSADLSRRLRAAYDDALASCDLLLMPTLPLKATRLPGPDAPLAEVLQRAFEMLGNTAPFDVTGHPAMSVPCGMSEDYRQA